MSNQLYRIKISNGVKSLHLLATRTALVSGIMLHTKNQGASCLQAGARTVTYIEYADSSGYIRGATRTFFIETLRAQPSLLVCFSRPYKELVFGKSGQNRSKNIMSSKALFEFWRSIFDGRCAFKKVSGDDAALEPSKAACKTYLWSNFGHINLQPYSSLEEIADFEDDPKTKIKRYFESVEDLFAGLLARTDFASGGLLFSKCECAGLSREEANTEGGSPEEALTFLRNADFSSSDKNEESTKLFLEAFKPDMVLWNAPFRDNKSINNSETKMIIPRKINDN